MKTIALVDPERAGHHAAFNRFFVKTLLQMSYKVVVLYPDPEEIESWIKDDEPTNSQNSFYGQYEMAPYNQGLFAFFQGIHNLKKLSVWVDLEKRLQSLEAKHGLTIDHVFFSWMDSYLEGYLHPALLRLFFTRKWSGLYFHPRHMRRPGWKLDKKVSFSDIDVVLSSSNCTGIAIHDESLMDIYPKRLDQKFVLFPEMADATPPDAENKMKLKILEEAKGRTIVGLIGLTAYKGLFTLINVARAADPSQFYFVIIGDLLIHKYPEHQQQTIKDFVDSPPENAFVSLKNLQEGKIFNSVFDAFDIPFLAYDNFVSSSNNLTKAVIFGKKVIASKNYCMGDDVENYHLGIAIEQGNVVEGLEAINHLKDHLDLTESEQKLFKQYEKQNSEAILKHKFRELFE